ncbi:hypothetical protein BDV96DRAFT_294037 [Lophiotrema nucula]|uniref:BTB domain-containing protein n=1 Tax=Lophiotrema nucula TaxID=690887 RepID=A0A6A5YNG3_9PLEO|nr:hypothetical protein BDV96DRAFT_294037 [Lophiotrema nucula]
MAQQSDTQFPHDTFPSDRAIVVHAKMYAIASKYFVRGLKERALDKFMGMK